MPNGRKSFSYNEQLYGKSLVQKVICPKLATIISLKQVHKGRKESGKWVPAQLLTLIFQLYGKNVLTIACWNTFTNLFNPTLLYPEVRNWIYCTCNSSFIHAVMLGSKSLVFKNFLEQ